MKKINRQPFFVAFCFSALMLTGCFQMFDPGKATVVKTSSNPQNTKQAILFLKDGNATEDNSLQVSIKKVGDNLGSDEVGNTFTTDSNHGKAMLDSTSISFKWIDINTLIIKYDGKLRTFDMNNNVNGVAVTYQMK